MKAHPLIIAAVFALTFVGADSVLAQRHSDRMPGYDRGRDYDRGNDRGNERDRRSGMSLDQAVKMVERQYNARVVRTEVRQQDDRAIYVLRLLNESGRVWTVRVDSSTGQVN